MATVKFEANFVSSLTAVLAHPQTGGEAGAAFTNRIEDLLARAQTALGKRAYGDAVALYKQAQSEIFRLLDPSHSPARHVLDNTYQLVVSPAIEGKLAEAGLKLAAVTQPTVKAALPPVGALGAPIPAALTTLDSIGFTAERGVPAAVTAQAALGVDLLDRGFADQAVPVLAQAAQALASPTTPEAKALAARVQLNLSSAHVLAGDPAGGQAAAAAAQTLFAGLNDAEGQAQALHNQGVALTQAGKAADAQAAFTHASALVKPAATPAAPAPPAPAAPAAAPATRIAVARKVTIQPTTDFSFITAHDAATLAVRLPGEAAAANASVAAPPPAAAKPEWSWLVPVGAKVAEIPWTGGKLPAPATLIDTVYKPRVAAKSLADLRVILGGTGETNAYLLHLYSFVIPQALGDCFSGSGQYALAESYYLQAAAYSYINLALEAPALWVRLADNTVRWGDSLYRDERVDDCRPIYSKVITQAGEAGTSPLYTLPVFAGPAANAEKLIDNFATPSAVAINPAIARPVLTAWARWQNLLAGLDFFGTTYTPVLTFEYLQQAAIAFAQGAAEAEREYIDFQSRAEAAAATRRELQSTAALADAAVAAQNAQYRAALADSAAAQSTVALATLRAKDAAADHDAYKTDGYWQYVSSSIAAAHSAHADWHEDEIRQLAANMESGSWSGDSGKLAAAATLLGGQKSYEYQLGRLQEAVGEMNATIPIAQQQAAAAAQRAESARLQNEAAKTHAALADDALAAFDNDIFTPEVWTRLANLMRGLSQDYLDWAISVAKLTERAYNFENDDDVQVIRGQYPGASDAADLLGADFLLRDINSFTYRFIAAQRAKQSQLKDVLSLANLYPFDFYRFQQTGAMSFETTLHDADVRHPGFYEQRIAGVEVEVVGLLPPEGLQGSLRAGGVSRYRKADGSERTRLHTADTLALSGFTLRDDAFVFRVDPRMHGLFEGHGIATTWFLDLPRRSNNADYRLITDVRLVLYYGAYYDAGLHDRVLAAEPLPGEMIHVRSLLLRFDFPEVWYTLLDGGEATFTVTPAYLPRNETGFLTQTLAVVVATADGVSPAGVEVTLTPPGKEAAAMTTDAGGQVASTAGNPLAAQLGGDVLGDWHLRLKPPAGSPLLGADGKLDGDKLEQVSLLLQYQFAWPA
jgi:Tc toxin complex TcA C-terminal TcB-binding domain